MNLLLALFTLLAQQNLQTPPCQVYNCYTASTGNVTLVSAGTAATIQQPITTAPFPFNALKATVQCSVTCVVTRSKDGTAATTTLSQSSIVQSPATPSGKSTPLTMQFYTASNASGGTTIDVNTINGGGILAFDMSDVSFGAVPGQTYTIAVGSITGTANITFYVGVRP